MQLLTLYNCLPREGFPPCLSCEGVAPGQREGRVAGLWLAGERGGRTKDFCIAALVNPCVFMLHSYSYHSKCRDGCRDH